MPRACGRRTTLEKVLGGAILFADQMRRKLEAVGVEPDDSPPSPDQPVVQTDVGLTYATATLVSLVDLGYVPGRWNSTRILRGLTFDLRTGEMFRVEACPESSLSHGQSFFRFGKLLQVCDQETHLKFVQLLVTRTARLDEQAARRKDPLAQWCVEKPDFIATRYREIVLYLTFEGLAVHTTDYKFRPRRDDCTLHRSAVNPVILPYRELAPFMMPGAWRDELLKLH